LDNICDALEQDGYITISLIQMLYSIPEVIRLSDETLITDYLEEIKGDPELYQRNDNGDFEAKVYREIQLGMEEDEAGNLIESTESRFFRLKPSSLEWEGIINIKPQSILAPSKELNKALTIEMLNLISPMMSNTTLEIDNSKMMGQEKSIDDTTFGKTIKQTLKMYDEDPKEWLPSSWLVPATVLPPGGSLVVPQGQAMMQGQQMGQQPIPQGAVNPMSAKPPTQPNLTGGVAGNMQSGLIGKLTGRME
jgi:hypothetical protein